jgi:hypothetical protein
MPSFDWVTNFEQLKDHETIDDFLTDLEEQHLLPNSWGDQTKEYAYEQVQQEAEG